jgi:hypothetical protein
MMALHLATIWGITAQSLGLPTSTANVPQAIANAIKLVIILAGLLATVMILYGSLQMIISTGSPQRFAKARETLTYAVIGLIVAIGALAIVSAVATYVH